MRLALDTSVLLTIFQREPGAEGLVRHQRRVFKSREPTTEDGAILLTLLIMTLEAIEIRVPGGSDNAGQAPLGRDCAGSDALLAAISAP